MNTIDTDLLYKIANMKGNPKGAFNIRKNGKLEARQNSEFIEIVTKTDKPGIDIRIRPYTKGEQVPYSRDPHRERPVRHGVQRLFRRASTATWTSSPAAASTTDGHQRSQHDGIHTFYVGKHSHVKYTEKHYGEGSGDGERILNPQTIVYLEEGASVELETVQIKGVDSTKRYTRVECAAGAEAIVTERLLTHGKQFAESRMEVVLNGEGARTQVVSRSVAQDESVQVFYPKVEGNAHCFGHVQCDSIIMGHAKVSSIPAIVANDMDAQLIHEAAIGKIAGDQILKLMTLGLTEEEAEQKILDGFLR